MEIIGVDIGGTKCTVVRADAEGTVADTRSFPTGDVRDTLARLYDAAGELIRGPDVVFGVTCGGPIDARAGLILSPPNLPGWDEVPVTRDLVACFGGRAFLMNDADAGALAEWRWGAARGAEDVIFCTHGTGFGAGLILGSRLYEGATGAAGEIGHVRLEADGPVGYGKAGSVEGFCSGGGIARLAARMARERGTEAPLTAREIALAAREGDGLCREVMNASGRQLGRALAVLVDLLNPEVIVLGGIFPRAGDLLRDAMEEALRDEALARSAEACRIVPAELGESIGERAPVAAALYRTGAFG